MQKIGSHGYMHKSYRSKVVTKKHSIWLVLFILGFAAGIIFAVMYAKESTSDFSAITSYIDLIKNITFIQERYFPYICVLRVMEVIALLGIIYIFHTPLFFCLLTIVMGNMFGYLLTIMTMIYGMKSCLFLPALLLPQYLFYVPVYIIFIKISEKKFLYENEYPWSSGGHKIVSIAASLVFIMVLAGILMESYVNPLIVKKIVKIFL